MPFSLDLPSEPCTVCTSQSNILRVSFGVGEVVNCSRCGDFEVSHVTVDDLGLPFTIPKKQALASYTIRKMQTPGARRPLLTTAFFHELETRALPTPAEASDNLIRWIAEKIDGSPGTQIAIVWDNPGLWSAIGAISERDVVWIVDSLKGRGLLSGSATNAQHYGNLTARGWERFEELKLAQIVSRFAFFAGKFENLDLDRVFNECLRPGVQATGYELRTVTQRAGLVDAVIEDEIRRCRFLLADLSDGNAGAYWEAGFAEGLGKPVIYVCRATGGGTEKKTHFDANHRHTVRWDLSSLDRTAIQLKAVIRNTLLGDARQAG
jgi:hypothetical protein